MINSPIVGVTLGWDAKPTTVHADGMVHLRTAENLLHWEYYPDGSGTWPRDPQTGEKLPTWHREDPPGLWDRIKAWLSVK